jgi:polysaccharide export outer membrane protein
MIQQKIFTVLILMLLAPGVASVRAQSNQVGPASGVIDATHVVAAGSEASQPQSPAAPKNETAAPSVTPKAATTASSGSWWGDFAEMVGLATSDPGLTILPTASHDALPAADYIIGPGDVIGITVWRDESLTRTVMVLPDGKISFPLLNDLVAGGKTVAQLKKELESGLTRFIADSNVTVEVKQSNSMIFYIIGRVNVPGRHMMLANTNVLQALAMAGGVNPYARKSKVKIFRQENGTTAMYPFNYNEVAEGRHLEMNIELKRGDVIIVP